VLANEQRTAEKFFQLLDLPADRALRQMKFVRGFREARVPHGRLEGDEALQGRKGRDAHDGCSHSIGSQLS